MNRKTRDLIEQELAEDASLESYQEWRAEMDLHLDAALAREDAQRDPMGRHEIPVSTTTDRCEMWAHDASDVAVMYAALDASRPALQAAAQAEQDRRQKALHASPAWKELFSW